MGRAVNTRDVAVIYLVQNTSGGLKLNLTFNVNCYFPSERPHAKEKRGEGKKLGLYFGKLNTYRVNPSYLRSDMFSKASRPRPEESRCGGTFGFPSGLAQGRRGQEREMELLAGTFSKKNKKTSALPYPSRYRTCNGSNYWQEMYLYTDASGEREKQAKSQSRKLLSHKLNP